MHKDGDQFFRIEEGAGVVTVDGRETEKTDGCIVIPAGARHNIKNAEDKPLKLYTLYAPPRTSRRLLRLNKDGGRSSERGFDGWATEG